MGTMARFLLAASGEPGRRLLRLVVKMVPGGSLLDAIFGTGAPLLLAVPAGQVRALHLIAGAGSDVKFMLITPGQPGRMFLHVVPVKCLVRLLVGGPGKPWKLGRGDRKSRGLGMGLVFATLREPET